MYEDEINRLTELLKTQEKNETSSLKIKVKFHMKVPSASQPNPQRETVSIDVINAEAVAVWYGCIDSRHALISTGDLSD